MRPMGYNFLPVLWLRRLVATSLRQGRPQFAEVSAGLELYRLGALGELLNAQPDFFVHGRVWRDEEQNYLSQTAPPVPIFLNWMVHRCRRRMRVESGGREWRQHR